MTDQLTKKLTDQLTGMRIHRGVTLSIKLVSFHSVPKEISSEIFWLFLFSRNSCRADQNSVPSGTHSLLSLSIYYSNSLSPLPLFSLLLSLTLSSPSLYLLLSLTLSSPSLLSIYFSHSLSTTLTHSFLSLSTLYHSIFLLFAVFFAFHIHFYVVFTPDSHSPRFD